MAIGICQVGTVVYLLGTGISHSMVLSKPGQSISMFFKIITIFFQENQQKYIFQNSVIKSKIKSAYPAPLQFYVGRLEQVIYHILKLYQLDYLLLSLDVIQGSAKQFAHIQIMLLQGMEACKKRNNLIQFLTAFHHVWIWLCNQSHCITSKFD